MEYVVALYTNGVEYRALVSHTPTPHLNDRVALLHGRGHSEPQRYSLSYGKAAETYPEVVYGSKLDAPVAFEGTKELFELALQLHEGRRRA